MDFCFTVRKATSELKKGIEPEEQLRVMRWLWKALR